MSRLSQIMHYMGTIQNTLQKFGFELSTGEIYVILAENGEMTVPQIAKKTTLSRASIYDSLSQLLAGGYLEYRKEGRNAFYKLNHPNKLFGLVEEKKRETEVLGEEMGSAIRTLIGSFNLSNNKPGVRFFEGKEGMIQAYEAILDIGKPILSFEDKGEMMEFFPDYVTKFVKRRIDNKIFNRSICPDTNTINEPNPERFIDSRHLPAAEFPFTMDIKICGDTIQFATLKEGQAAAIHINHQIIAENFRVLFEFLWKKTDGAKTPPANKI